MRPIIILLILASVSVRAQDDFTAPSDSVVLSQDGTPIPLQAATTYVYKQTDSISYELNSGFNVLNAIRGYVPSPTFGAYSPNVFGGGMRNPTSMLIIDGFAIPSRLIPYLNLNTFDYTNLAVTGTHASVATFPMTGETGAVFVDSRNGATADGHTIDFASNSSLFLRKKWHHFQLTNAVAYSMDFGSVDTRLSINHTMAQPLNRLSDSNFGIKANTGFQASKKLSGRIILDGNYMREGFLVFNEEIVKNFIGNAQFKYKLSDRTTISSHVAHNNFSLASADSRREMRHLYYLADAFLNSERQLDDFAVVGSLGYQYTYYLEPELGSHQAHAIIVRGSGNYRNIFFTNFSGLVANDERQSYSLGSAFIFTRAWNLQTGLIREGKVRANAAYTTGVYSSAQPFTFEGGFDFSLKEEITVQLNYYWNKNIQPEPFREHVGVFLFDPFSQQGWEVSLKKISTLTPNMRLFTSFNWWTMFFDATNRRISATDLTIKRNSPDWMSTIMNRVEYKRYFFSLVIEGQLGGGRRIPYEDSPFRNDSKLRISEVSTGYHWRGTGRIHSFTIALTGRNVVSIVKSEFDRTYPNYFVDGKYVTVTAVARF